jgi:hypothetical protein
MSTGIVASIDTITSLRAYSGSIPSLGDVYSFEVQGYSSIGDGGGGSFFYNAADTATDNGGTIIVDAAGRRWWRLFPDESLVVEWFGAVNRGAADDSAAIQAAIEVAVNSGHKNIKFMNGPYLINTPLNCTSDGSRNCSGISIIGHGRRGGTTLQGNTGGCVFDLSGSAWMKFYGVYITAPPSPTAISTCGWIACSTAGFECLYNTWEQCYFDLYNTDAPTSLGTVAILAMGAEEASLIANQFYAGTPVVLTTTYATFSADYPSPYQNGNVVASHSQGVTTFAGENLLVTYDQQYWNLYLSGANSTDCGNMYFGNLNISPTPGTNPTCITVRGGTLEGFRGRFKIEEKTNWLSIDAVGPELYSWDVTLTWGGTSVSYAASVPTITINPSAAQLFTGRIVNFNVDVAYYDPSAAIFANKPLLGYVGASSGGALSCQLVNITFRTNQTQAQGPSQLFPGLFCGQARGCSFEFVDYKYFLDAHKHVKQFYSCLGLGPGDGSSPVSVGTIHLPSISTGFSARAITATAKGLLSAINEIAGAGEADVTLIPVKTSVSAFSTNNGAITVGSSPSDNWINGAPPPASALSNNAGLILFTGMSVNLTYDSGTRTISITANSTGTGTNLPYIGANINDLQIEMLTSGRIGELIYIT